MLPCPLKFVATEESLKLCLSYIVRAFWYYKKAKAEWYLSLDLEGPDLGRHGSVSIVAIYVPFRGGRIYHIDTRALGTKAFTTPCVERATLKAILEYKYLTKLFFDVRCDSDALFRHYKVKLVNVIDVQLMSVATEAYTGDFLMGLSKCREKEEICGAYQMTDLNERGVKTAWDVFSIAQLWWQYDSRLTPGWRERVAQETQKRIDVCLKPSFNNEAPHMVDNPFYGVSNPQPIRENTNDHLQPGTGAGSVTGGSKPTFSGFFRFGGTPNNEPAEPAEPDKGDVNSNLQDRATISQVTLPIIEDTIAAAPVISASTSLD